jgi:hypothetical protein
MAMTIFMRCVSLFSVRRPYGAGGRDGGTAEPAGRRHSSRFKTRAKRAEKAQPIEKYRILDSSAIIAAMQRPYRALKTGIYVISLKNQALESKTRAGARV